MEVTGPVRPDQGVSRLHNPYRTIGVGPLARNPDGKRATQVRSKSAMGGGMNPTLERTIRMRSMTPTPRY